MVQVRAEVGLQAHCPLQLLSLSTFRGRRSVWESLPLNPVSGSEKMSECPTSRPARGCEEVSRLMSTYSSRSACRLGLLTDRTIRKDVGCCVQRFIQLAVVLLVCTSCLVAGRGDLKRAGRHLTSQVTVDAYDCTVAGPLQTCSGSNYISCLHFTGLTIVPACCNVRRL